MLTRSRTSALCSVLGPGLGQGKVSLGQDKVSPGHGKVSWTPRRLLQGKQADGIPLFSHRELKPGLQTHLKPVFGHTDEDDDGTAQRRDWAVSGLTCGMAFLHSGAS